MYRVWLLISGVLLTCLAMPQTLLGQYGQPPSYSDYYSSQVGKRVTPNVSARQYTIDKYFYKKPTISPYLNLTRQSDSLAPAYQTYVRPEVERRSAAPTRPGTSVSGANYNPARPSPAAPARPAPAAGHYHNHWYGSRSSMGLK